jgi:hypothetical protein
VHVVGEVDAPDDVQAAFGVLGGELAGGVGGAVEVVAGVEGVAF